MRRKRLKEISHIYNAALELPENERAAFLETCEDEDLRQEVLSLLRNEDKAKSFLEECALDVASRLKARTQPSLLGRQLGSFNLISVLGKGGMGEVYRAKDQKLGRDVAIKVLSEEFAQDDMRISRFQREAKLLASLNHPNIAAIHGLEESDGTQFLVLELIEGDTLADRLKRGAIPVEEALKLALQIAQALESAHEQGVIHRDLKPANIKVAPDGKVKILDFGLAKAFDGQKPDMNLSDSPTLSDAATRQGVILGTASYMSPEQAKGRSVDKRTDIWAFGCVLYEMLSGHEAFGGEDITEILASVVKADVNMALLPADIHPRMRELLAHCLQKDLRKRYRDIGDVRFILEQVQSDPTGMSVRPVSAKESRTIMRQSLPWIAAVCCIVLAGAAVWNFRTPEPPRMMQFEYELPEGQQSNQNLAISPDGSQFVYGTVEGLYLRTLDSLDSRLISGTDNNSIQPFFSPDGQWIGYWSRADDKLKKISVRGGKPVPLCDAGEVRGAVWASDNSIVYADIGKGLLRVPSGGGGTPELLEEGSFADPQLLPGGEALMFTDISSEQYRIVVQSLESGDRKELFGGEKARYLPTGHLVYWLQDNSNLFAVPFDPDSIEFKGEMYAMVEGVGLDAVSESGTLLYTPSATMSGRTLVWVDRQGQEEPLSAPPRIYRFPKISPDKTKVALTIEHEGVRNSWIWDIVRKTLTRLTFGRRIDIDPLWTSDGRNIVVYSYYLWGQQTSGIKLKAADGAGEETHLYSPEQLFFPFCWSHDEKYLVGTISTMNYENFDIGMLSMEGEYTLTPLLQESYHETMAQVSPNGRWIAYASNESGQYEIYVRSFPEVDKKRQLVSTDGGDSPLWSPDGSELYYLNGAAAMSVEVKTEPGFSAGTPKILFQGEYVGTLPNNGTPWDIHPDGKRFLMLKPPGTVDGRSEAGPPRSINIILNWSEELKERVPAR